MRRMHKKNVVNFVCQLVILSVLIWLVANFKRLWGAPAQRGFFCDDATLKLPYHEDTISKSQLYVIGLYTPVAVMLLLEAVQLLYKYRLRREEGLTLHDSDFSVLYNSLVSFLFGFTAERLIKSLAKHTVGRLRPHFLAVCQPQVDGDVTCAETQRIGGIYLEDYTCRGAQASPKMLRAVHLSFPSGHASLSFYSMVFLVLYLERHFADTRSRGLILMRHAVQLAFMLLAWFVALSRVMDNMHHWSDVLSGIVLGMLVAIVVSRCMAQPWEEGAEKSRKKVWPLNGAPNNIDLEAIEAVKN